MIAEIEVLKAGLFSTIQDVGRFGFRKYGVPESGVMDNYAAKMSNLLLGNSMTSAVLEITMMGPELKFQSETKIAICGANLSPVKNDKEILLNQPISIKAGDILKFGSRKSGCRAYLGIKGGFKTEKVMESRSWYDGITTSSRLEKNSSLKYSMYSASEETTNSVLKFEGDYLTERSIQVYKGPEFEKLQNNLVEQWIATEFTLTENSNRMAIQFKEELNNELDPIITGPVMPGTIQLTPSGNVIVLMKDCQTSGGYPRVFQLSEEAIRILAQKIPGEKISFEIISF